MPIDAAGQVTIDLAIKQLTGLLQRHLPELLTGLHIIGSVTDGDFRSGRSDLDFVAVLARPASDDDIEGLFIVHRLYASDPTLPLLGGIWVTDAELAAGPDECREGPTSHDNAFLRQAVGNRNPVTWVTLRENALTIIGQLDASKLWYDPARLQSWTRENVETYWAPWLARASGLISSSGLAMLGSAAPMWGVLGISRLHYTLATGKIASKSAAGEYALKAFDPSWQKIVGECLRIRRGSGRPLYPNPFRRRREALDFVAMVIAEIRAGVRSPGSP